MQTMQTQWLLPGDYCKYGRVAATATTRDGTIYYTTVDGTYWDDYRGGTARVVRFTTFRVDIGKICSIVEVEDGCSGKSHWVRGAARAANNHPTHGG